jgi:hypothetical protein
MNLDVEPITGERLGDVLFGIDANRATSMIKDSFCFHEPIAAHGQIRQKKVREALDPLTPKCKCNDWQWANAIRRIARQKRATFL